MMTLIGEWDAWTLRKFSSQFYKSNSPHTIKFGDWSYRDSCSSNVNTFRDFKMNLNKALPTLARSPEFICMHILWSTSNPNRTLILNLNWIWVRSDRFLQYFRTYLYHVIGTEMNIQMISRPFRGKYKYDTNKVKEANIINYLATSSVCLLFNRVYIHNTVFSFSLLLLCNPNLHFVRNWDLFVIWIYSFHMAFQLLRTSKTIWINNLAIIQI